MRQVVADGPTARKRTLKIRQGTIASDPLFLCEGIAFRVREEPRYAFAAYSKVKRDGLVDHPLISISGFAFFPIGARPTLNCFSRSVDSCSLECLAAEVDSIGDYRS